MCTNVKNVMKFSVAPAGVMADVRDVVQETTKEESDM